MTSSTTVRRSATNHKGVTSQRTAADHKATERHEATPDQQAPDERAQRPGGKAERSQAAPGTLPLGVKLPGVAKGNLLWWGGLAALAALEIVDWPVAALVAAGTWMAERHVKQRQQRQPARAEAGS